MKNGNPCWKALAEALKSPLVGMTVEEGNSDNIFYWMSLIQFAECLTNFIKVNVHVNINQLRGIPSKRSTVLSTIHTEDVVHTNISRIYILLHHHNCYEST